MIQLLHNDSDSWESPMGPSKTNLRTSKILFFPHLDYSIRPLRTSIYSIGHIAKGMVTHLWIDNALNVHII